MLAPKANALLSHLQGMVLKSAEMVPDGMQFIYEDEAERVTLCIRPKVYTLGKNIVDPINDMTLRMEVQRQSLAAGSQAVQVGSVEIAFSGWLGEGYL